MTALIWLMYLFWVFFVVVVAMLNNQKQTKCEIYRWWQSRPVIPQTSKQVITYCPGAHLIGEKISIVNNILKLCLFGISERNCRLLQKDAWWPFLRFWDISSVQWRQGERAGVPHCSLRTSNVLHLSDQLRKMLSVSRHQPNLSSPTKKELVWTE